MKKILLLSALLAFTLPSYALDAQDAGEYVLLDKQQQPTPMQMRFYQKSGQWMMDGKTAHENWRAVCRGEGQCRLQDSSAAQIRTHQANLPTSLRQLPLSCIQNVAFAFCRVADSKNAQRRVYLWLPLMSEARGSVLELKRVK